MNITEFAILKKMVGKGGGNASEVDAFVVKQGEVYSMSDVMRELGSNLSVRLVQTLPDNLIKSNFVDTVYLYIVESTGIGYADFGDAYGIVTAGQVAFLYADGYDKGWTTDIYSATEDGVYYVRKNSGANAVTETSVASSFDNTGDGIAEVYSFSKALPTRFTSGYAIEIDAVKDITDDNGIHQESSTNNHYSRYDEIATDTGTMPYAHVYCKDNSKQYLYYSFNVSEEGIYELCAHLRIKDAQLRGATYTINKGESYEHVFVTTHGFGSEDEAFEIRNNDHLQGSYMSGMTVYLRKGINTIRITNAAGVTKNQHFRNLYLVKKTDISIEYKDLTMDEAEKMGVGLAKGAKIFSPYYITVTFNNGAPRDTDGFCRVRTSNGNLMSIQSIDTNGTEMPLEGDTVTLAGKIGCVNSAVNGSIGKEARIFDATII